jgi:ribosome maturation factor RimP
VSRWARAHLFFGIEPGDEDTNPVETMNETERLQETIEARLRELDPAVELIALERPARDSLRLYIDRPEGVDLALCERVTNHLRDLLERFALEVSSPGADRPLTKPEHFRRFLGRKVRVRTREAIEGRKSFTGTLTEAGDDIVAVEAEGGAVRIPISGIRRSNLVPDFGLGGNKQ